MKLTVRNGQSIFDVALIAYSDASMVYRLMEENPQIEHITSDLTGMVLTFTQVLSSNPKEAQKFPGTVKKKVVISSTQSLFDIALQYTGSAENVFDVIRNNPQLENILSDPAGLVLNYEPSATYIPEYYRAKTITISTKPLAVTSSQGSYLVLQNGFHLQQENGSFILLE